MKRQRADSKTSDSEEFDQTTDDNNVVQQHDQSSKQEEQEVKVFIGFRKTFHS